MSGNYLALDLQNSNGNRVGFIGILNDIYILPHEYHVYTCLGIAGNALFFDDYIIDTNCRRLLCCFLRTAPGGQVIYPLPAATYIMNVVYDFPPGTFDPNRARVVGLSPELSTYYLNLFNMQYSMQAPVVQTQPGPMFTPMFAPNAASVAPQMLTAEAPLELEQPQEAQKVEPLTTIMQEHSTSVAQAQTGLRDLQVHVSLAKSENNTVAEKSVYNLLEFAYDPNHAVDFLIQLQEICKANTNFNPVLDSRVSIELCLAVLHYLRLETFTVEEKITQAFIRHFIDLYTDNAQEIQTKLLKYGIEQIQWIIRNVNDHANDASDIPTKLTTFCEQQIYLMLLEANSKPIIADTIISAEAPLTASTNGQNLNHAVTSPQTKSKKSKAKPKKTNVQNDDQFLDNIIAEQTAASNNAANLAKQQHAKLVSEIVSKPTIDAFNAVVKHIKSGTCQWVAIQHYFIAKPELYTFKNHDGVNLLMMLVSDVKPSKYAHYEELAKILMSKMHAEIFNTDTTGKGVLDYWAKCVTASTGKLCPDYLKLLTVVFMHGCEINSAAMKYQFSISFLVDILEQKKQPEVAIQIINALYEASKHNDKNQRHTLDAVISLIVLGYDQQGRNIYNLTEHLLADALKACKAFQAAAYVKILYDMNTLLADMLKLLSAEGSDHTKAPSNQLDQFFDKINDYFAIEREDNLIAKSLSAFNAELPHVAARTTDYVLTIIDSVLTQRKILKSQISLSSTVQYNALLADDVINTFLYYLIKPNPNKVKAQQLINAWICLEAKAPVGKYKEFVIGNLMSRLVSALSVCIYYDPRLSLDTLEELVTMVNIASAASDKHKALVDNMGVRLSFGAINLMTHSHDKPTLTRSFTWLTKMLDQCNLNAEQIDAKTANNVLHRVCLSIKTQGIIPLNSDPVRLKKSLQQMFMGLEVLFRADLNKGHNAVPQLLNAKNKNNKQPFDYILEAIKDADIVIYAVEQIQNLCARYANETPNATAKQLVVV